MPQVAIHGYSDRLSVAPGERIRFMVSVEGAENYRADIVRLICGDIGGTRLKEEVVASPLNREYPARYQPIHAGSHVAVDDSSGKLSLPGAFTIHAFVMPTSPGRGAQGIASRWDEKEQSGYALVIGEDAKLALWIGAGAGHVARVIHEHPMAPWTWYSVAAVFDSAASQVRLYQKAIKNPAAASRASRVSTAIQSGNISANVDRAVFSSPGKPKSATPVIIAGFAASNDRGVAAVAGHFNGKIDHPRIYSRALEIAEIESFAAEGEPDRADIAAEWDFAANITSAGIPDDTVLDKSANRMHGRCVNNPMRAATGHNWTGHEFNFTRARAEYGAIHFHDDDIEDAGWEADFELITPADMKSDVYAARLRAGEAEEYIPFFVRAPAGQRSAEIAFLAPTTTYLAYANEKMRFDAAIGEVAFGRTAVINEEDIYLYQHPELGSSTYDVHSDGSGVCFSSRLRPIVNMRPRYRHGITVAPWGFPADLDLIDWLNANGYRYDVLTDEDLDREGVAAIRDYKTVLTGTHPEYYSEAMLDAVEDYLADGGRLMYLGGNGFYRPTTYHPRKPHLIEIRKGDTGVRTWQGLPGEHFHSSNGELGGLWRNRGRAPQKLVGVGFAAQGFEIAAYYRRMPDSFDPRAAFIFEGIGNDELIGNFGHAGGGAAGLELDRYDLELGTPADALLLASSEGHTDNMLHVVEEVLSMLPGLGGTQDPFVRADLVYFPTPNGGGVFSTGSIAWCASLAHNNHDNNVSRITKNVLDRFLSGEPLK
ncbi:MAG: N,N-dimethylformamidase beta subunit family domain-containing protein [Candidatus Binataceae bacterium]